MQSNAQDDCWNAAPELGHKPEPGAVGVPNGLALSDHFMM